VLSTPAENEPRGYLVAADSPGADRRVDNFDVGEVVRPPTGTDFA